jgi:holliday junction DNA helicase RuvB
MSLSAGNGEQHLLRHTLSIHVGQEHIKRHSRWLINVVKEHWGGDLLLPNLLLCGPPETGKATQAHAIAHELGVNVHHTSSAVLPRPGDLAAVLTQPVSGDVVVVGQVESLRPGVLSPLLEAIEDFTMDLTIGHGYEKRTMRLDLPYFIFVGTSVNPSQIDSRLRPWFIEYNLLPYSIDQISKLIQVFGERQQIAVRDGADRLLAE